MTEFKLERHKLLGHEIALQGLYIVDVPSDGNCQFEALAIGLDELGEHPPCDCQVHVLRDRIVEYLLANKELFETGQQQAFLHGDPSFKRTSCPPTAMITPSSYIAPLCAIQRE